MIEIIITILSGFIASVFAGLGAYLIKRKATEEKERFAEEVERVANKKLEIGFSVGGISLKRVIESGPEAIDAPSPELLRHMEKQLLSRLAASSSLTTESLQQELDNQMTDLRKSLAKIESRFPEEAKLEKVSSINDALLSERIDQLAKQVDNLEKRVLSKWDVALTVSTIIAGIAFVVGATYAVLKLIVATS